jgi:AraC-like DNA-binding protein
LSIRPKRELNRAALHLLNELGHAARCDRRKEHASGRSLLSKVSFVRQTKLCCFVQQSTENYGFQEQIEAKLDPITDIFRTMHVTAFGQHRLEATAPWGLIQAKQTEEQVTLSVKTKSPEDLAHFAMVSRGNCWLSVDGYPDPIPLTGGDCFLLARNTSIVMRDSPRTRPRSTFREIIANAQSNVVHYGDGGAPTTIVCGSFSFDRPSLKPITQLLPRFILIKADQARTLALHNTMQALASEMAEQAPGSGVVATRLAEVLFIQVLRAHIASVPERNEGWLRAVFDPQLGTALSAVHDRVNTPWTVESLAEAAGMSRSAFAARFKEILGQTPLEYVTGWRMQKAMQLLEQRDKKLIDVARSVGYESDAAFSKAFKRVVGANPSEYLKRGI